MLHKFYQNTAMTRHPEEKNNNKKEKWGFLKIPVLLKFSLSGLVILHRASL